MRYLLSDLITCTPKKEKKKNKNKQTANNSLLEDWPGSRVYHRATGADMPAATPEEGPDGDPFMGDTAWLGQVNYRC